MCDDSRELHLTEGVLNIPLATLEDALNCTQQQTHATIFSFDLNFLNPNVTKIGAFLSKHCYKTQKHYPRIWLEIVSLER